MNQYFNRHIDRYLAEWKQSDNRKPLLIRGARQVGKSSAVRHLGASFDYFVEINLEKQREYISLFGDNLDVKMICSQIALMSNIPVVPGKTLLFIDEIQESQRAIAALRFFYEDYPELHVVAAGSLLEFALNELPSFGVGRIRSMYMYPFSFDEFLMAQGLDMQVDYKRNECTPQRPLPEPLHRSMIEQLKSFYIVGGMPEAVRVWVNTHDYTQCRLVHRDLLDTYQDDFSKYKSRISPLLLSPVLKSVAVQAGSKFVYSRVSDTANGRNIAEAVSLLVLAGLIIPVTHTSASGLPLGSEANPKYRKFIFIDIALMQSILGFDAREILLASDIDFTNKGGMSEVFAGLEMLKYGDCFRRAEMYYWQRLDKNALAEVDYVTTLHNDIVPIEVKASYSGSMQSLRRFIALKDSVYGIRASLEPFAAYDKIKVIPLYALSTMSHLNE